ncbi:MAG TPA: PKD domain-containing protein [Flavisolibacter sp.]
MKTIRHILLLLSILIGTTGASGQNIEFIENKGQWDAQVRYMGQIPNGAFFIHSNGYTVLQHHADDMQQLHNASHNHEVKGDVIVRSHAYRVRFENANEQPRIIADKPLYTYNNYFIGDDPSRWASNCQLFQGITVKDLYPGIDLRYYTDKGMMKYDLIVNPGGRVSDIVLKYEGTDRLDVRNRELVIGTSVGELKELQPYTYQHGESGRVTVSARYVQRENTIRFNVGDYDQKSTLVIDPTLVFSSYSGSTVDNWGFTATYGPDGSMFGGGIVFGTGFPVSPGAFQTNYGGGSGCFSNGFDIGIIKLSPNGTSRIYATYLGGSGNEMPQSLIVDPQGNLIVAGRTNSPVSGGTPYPIVGALIGPGGDWDIVVTKLNAAGTALIGSRRIGGTSDDGANMAPCGSGGPMNLQRNYGDQSRSEVNLDASGNVYVASCTKSTGALADRFPVTPGAFQPLPGTQQDGVLLKFNSNLSTLLFSSFFGGDGNDAAYVVSINPFNGNIYIAGGTESSNLPGPTAGSLGPANHGGIDGFVSIVTPDGAALVKTTYVGTSSIDQVYGIQFDLKGFPYVMGQTTGSWPVINAPWSQANGKQFIAKLQPDLGAYVYSTMFGKGSASPDISPVAFLVDRCENVYVSGWGGAVIASFPNAGTGGLTVTPDAIKSTTDISPGSGIGQDFYFFVLKRDATGQLFGSFFGQNGGQSEHVDGGTSRFDQNGVIYQAICANCGSSGVSFPTYPNPGVWAATKPAGASCNLAMVKIELDLAGVRGGVLSVIDGVVRDTAGCVPLTVEFRDTVQMAVSYEWNFGDGPNVFTTTSPSITHTYSNIGTYQVMMVAIDSTKCNIRDTSYMTIRVDDLRAQLDFNAVKLNPCDSFKYRFDNISVAPAARPFGAGDFIWNFGDGSPSVVAGPESVFHQYASPGTYTVQLILKDSVYCNYPDTITKQIRVASLVKADFDTPPNGCAPYTAQFTNTSDAGSQFIWDFGDGPPLSNEVSPSHIYQVPGTYTVTLIAIDSATCNISDTTTFTITVYDIPVADFSAAPQPPMVNVPISFTNLSSPDAVRFHWYFGDGDSLITTSRNVVQHEYNATGAFNACLVAFNPAGCADTICREVRTLIEPALDVPNAFTPLSGGVNSIVYVRGFGIAKMKFTIWSRWGQKVFEANDKRIGWDGRFKGEVLPMDVYAYTLDVEFSDGTKATKKGDITLIR